MPAPILEAFSCQSCGAERLLTDTRSADIVCCDCGTVCGKWSPEDAHDKTPWWDGRYFRKSYFHTVMGVVLGHEGKTVSKAQLEAIGAFVKADPKLDVNAQGVRTAMYRLKLTKLYKSTPAVVHLLRTGGATRFPRLTHYELEALENMFDEASGLFDRVAWRGRKNIISYNYVIMKLLGLIGRGADFQHFVVPIKTKSKLVFADKVWAEVDAAATWRSDLPLHRLGCTVANYRPKYQLIVKRVPPKRRSRFTPARTPPTATPGCAAAPACPAS
jgi:hypothetical protein